METERSKTALKVTEMNAIRWSMKISQRKKGMKNSNNEWG